MTRRPPRSNRTNTPVPYTTLFRSKQRSAFRRHRCCAGIQYRHGRRFTHAGYSAGCAQRQYRHPARGCAADRGGGMTAELTMLQSQGAHVRDLTSDSRKVQDGALFLAYPGERTDGRAFIAQSIAQGAAAVLWESEGFAVVSSWQS